MADQILTWIVVILPTIFALVIEVVSKEVKEKPSWRIGVIVLGVLLSALTWIQIARAAKSADKQQQDAIVATSEKVSAKVSESVSKSVSESLRNEYQLTINALQSQLGVVHNQLAEEGKKVDVIQGSNIVTGKSPLRVEIANPNALPNASSSQPTPHVSVSSLPVATDLRYGKLALEVILTTNRTMDGGRAKIVCSKKINNGSATLAGASSVFGGGRMIDEKTFQSDIEMPNWSPDRPLIITLYSDEQVQPCTVIPLS